jgi:hypothetical protein
MNQNLTIQNIIVKNKKKKKKKQNWIRLMDKSVKGQKYKNLNTMDLEENRSIIIY